MNMLTHTHTHYHHLPSLIHIIGLLHTHTHRVRSLYVCITVQNLQIHSQKKENDFIEKKKPKQIFL